MRTKTTQELLDQKTLTEREILALRMRFNGTRLLHKRTHPTKKVGDYHWRDSYQITQAQTDKGLAWLLNLYKSPTGRERKNNPFGTLEADALENFDHFEFLGFYDDSSPYGAQIGYFNYLPIYRVVGRHSGFDYVPYPSKWSGRERADILIV